MHESGGVVDAIAYHRDPGVDLKLSNDSGLVLWQDSRVNLVDANVPADPLCRALVVTGDEDRPETCFAQRGDGRDGVRSECIAQGDNAQRASIPSDGDHGASRGLQVFDGLTKRREVNIEVGEEARTADEDLAGVDACNDTPSGERLE